MVAPRTLRPIKKEVTDQDGIQTVTGQRLSKRPVQTEFGQHARRGGRTYIPEMLIGPGRIQGYEVRGVGYTAVVALHGKRTTTGYWEAWDVRWSKAKI